MSKLDSEDSSYDSDYENSEPGGGTPEAQHDEVSRTVSDTLGAEFSEYVSLQPKPRVEDEDADAVFSDPNYSNRIEFALKLGYTEQQGYTALQKLGPKAEQNELLAELIKLGASAPAAAEQRAPGGVGADATSAMAKKKDPSATVAGTSAASCLRHIVIDGSNVAMSHGNKELYSCHGIKLCVDWFKAHGHKDITVFVPLWRKEMSRPDTITKDQEILWELEKERLLVFTPSRQMGGRRVACHDDRYILKLAAETDGIVVSNDNYRDLLNESPEYKRVVEERLLMYSFVNDRFMPPDDPMGRHGPSLDTFLQKQGKPLEPLAPSCPYGKKCTYGNKCKYYHPERGNQPHKSVSEQLAEQAKIHIQEVKAREGNKLKVTMSSPLPTSPPVEASNLKRALHRTRSLVVPAAATAPPPADGLGDARLASTSEAVLTVRHPNAEYDAQPPAPWMPQFYEELSEQDAVRKAKGAPAAASKPHNKLQRQLTLNPNYDPRLVHMRALQQKLYPAATPRAEPEQPEQHHKERLVRHSSAGAVEKRGTGATRGPGPWCPAEGGGNLHQNVTRIASAPDSYHQWHHRQGPPPPHPSNAASDPQLHRYVWQNQQQPQPWRQAHEEQRHHIYYHLASVFPAEQVRAAMEMNLEETNPQAICAAILAMFPKAE